MMRRASIAWALSLAPYVAWASESDVPLELITFADVRFGYAVPMGSMHGSYQAAGTSMRSDRVTWSRAGDLSLRWVPSIGRASDSGEGMMAVGLVSSSYTLDGDAGREAIRQRLVLGVIDLGLAWVPSPRWTIEGTWKLGLGRAWQPGELSRAGSAWSGGVGIEATRQWSNGFLLGVHLGAEWRTWTTSAVLDGVRYDLAFQGVQYAPGVLIGWRF